MKSIKKQIEEIFEKYNIKLDTPYYVFPNSKLFYIVFSFKYIYYKKKININIKARYEGNVCYEKSKECFYTDVKTVENDLKKCIKEVRDNRNLLTQKLSKTDIKTLQKYNWIEIKKVD